MHWQVLLKFKIWSWFLKCVSFRKVLYKNSLLKCSWWAYYAPFAVLRYISLAMTPKICGIKIIVFMPWKHRMHHIVSNSRNENVLKRRFSRMNLNDDKTVCVWIIYRLKLYHFTVTNTHFTAQLTHCVKTIFGTVKWYNLCMLIIQSHTCYPLIIYLALKYLQEKWIIFSSPEPKPRVSYCHSAPSVVRP